MRRTIVLLALLCCSSISLCQEVSDLFKQTEYEIQWLGVDYSNVKLIGDFSQFFNAGEKNANQIRDEYFLGWNQLILREPDKYDIKGMLRLNKMSTQIDMIMSLNSSTDLSNLQSYNNPEYTTTEIDSIVSNYPIDKGSGIGILFIAESLNKYNEEAFYHFVAINMETKKVLIQERLRGEPSGFGLRNYWAGSIYAVIKEIKKKKYSIWRYTYGT